MKHSREFYEDKAHEAIRLSSALLDTEDDQAITWALMSAQVYATLATAADSEPTIKRVDTPEAAVYRLATVIDFELEQVADGKKSAVEFIDYMATLTTELLKYPQDNKEIPR